MVWHAKITEDTVKQLKSCKVIVKYGTGYDNIDTEACKNMESQSAIHLIMVLKRFVIRHAQ